MNKFAFTWMGIDKNRRKQRGALHNNSLSETLHHLKQQKILPIRVKKRGILTSTLTKHRINKKAAQQIIEQLSTLLHAGFPLSQSLAHLEKSAKAQPLRTMLHDIKSRIDSGDQISNAFRCYPEIFSSAFCALIAAGEQTGKLSKAFKTIVTQQARSAIVKEKFMRALIYPITVLTLSFLITTCLLIFVIPQFQDAFQNFGASLPSLTQRVIKISSFMKESWPYGALSALALVSSITLIQSCEAGRLLLSNLILAIPFIKQIVRLKNTALWSSTIAQLLQAGIPLIKAIEASQNILNPSLKQRFKRIIKPLQNGKPLSEILTPLNTFSTESLALISIGEESSTLGQMLEKAGAIEQHTLDTRLNRLSQLLEPLLMIGLAALIGIIILAMYLPIFQMGHYIQ